MQALLIGQFLPLLVLVPVIGAMALVTTSIVDELHARSLEPLLATPITTLELLVAKAGQRVPGVAGPARRRRRAAGHRDRRSWPGPVC